MNPWILLIVIYCRIWIDPEQAKAYKTLGIYYLKLEDVIKAAENFNKAVELDKNIDLENYAGDLKQLINESSTA